MPRAMDRPCRAEWKATTSAAARMRAAFTVTSSGSPGPRPTPYSVIQCSFDDRRQRVDGGRSDGAAAAAAVHDQVLQVGVREGLLRLGRTDEPDRDPQHGSGSRATGGDKLEQVEQRG